MPLPLDKTLKREILLGGKPYTVTIAPHGVKLTAKGFRKGRVLSWEALWAVAEAEDGAEGGGGAPGAVPPASRGRGTT